MEADFSGYATKAGLKCSDGRTITPEAFAHQDAIKVPLVWQHGHNDPNNVLGHAILEKRKDGVYAKGFFNDTEPGQNAKKLVEHGDITALSIFANQLVEKSKTVLHGVIREVSLVLSGANPGALIDYVRVAHSDGEIEISDEDAIIYTGLTLEHGTKTYGSKSTTTTVESVDGNVTGTRTESYENSRTVETPDTVPNSLAYSDLAHAKDGEETVQDVYDTLNEKQKQVVHYMIGAAIEAATADNSVAQSGLEDDGDATGSNGTDTTNEGDLAHQEGNTDMSRNVFDQNGAAPTGPTLSHSDLKGIMEDAKKIGSVKEAFENYALAHSITDIDVLFPDAKLVGGVELIARRSEFAAEVLNAAKKSPFSRIKSLAADLTADEARAKGYVKGSLKKEEIIKLLRRVTEPTTIYKKQALDRDDILDITDVDVVAWLKAEMRLMLDEELARAVLVGDGREPDDEDKIDEDRLRPIAWDNDMYTHSVTVPANVDPDSIVESILRARTFFKGTGTPALYTTDSVLTDLILQKDRMGRRLYATEQELAAALRVSKIVTVEVMEDTPDLLAVIVNMNDYTMGADRGGQVSMFDDFDIDYNKQKYLLETRVSGALTKPKSALVIKRTSGTTVTPVAPAYNASTHVLTVPTVTGVTYYDVTDETAVVLTAGNKTLTRTTDVEARPDTGYNFPHNTDADWTYAFVA